MSEAYQTSGIPQAALNQLQELVRQEEENSQNAPQVVVTQEESPTETESERIAKLEEMVALKDQQWRTLQGMLRKANEEKQELLKNQEYSGNMDASDLQEKYSLSDEISEDPDLIMTIERIADKRFEEKKQQDEENRVNSFFSELNILMPTWESYENHPLWTNFATPQVDAILKSALQRNDPQAAANVYTHFEQQIIGAKRASTNQILEQVQPNPSATPVMRQPQGEAYNQSEHLALLGKSSRGAITKTEKERLDVLDHLYRTKL